MFRVRLGFVFFLFCFVLVSFQADGVKEGRTAWERKLLLARKG